MKLGAPLGAILLAALVAWMLATDGVWRILYLLANASWIGLAAVVLFHFIQVLFSAAAWRTLAGPTVPRPGLGRYMTVRVIREAVNNLLPVAQIGGEFVGARLLNRDGVRLSSALAGVIGDLTVEMATQIAFTLLGLGLLLLTVGDGGIAGMVASFLLLAIVVAAGFVAAQWVGLARLFEIGLSRFGRITGLDGLGEVAGLHTALIALYRAHRRLLGAAFYHFVSWLLGGVEVCLALHVLGSDVNLAAGLVIESLGQAFKSIGFAVPGALGVQEGGYILVCGLYGLSPELAIALSLVKRLREIALGVPGLVAWRWFEARSAVTTVPLPGSGAVP